MSRRHPRCELCAHYPDGFHCWAIECVAVDDDGSFDDGTYEPEEETPGEAERLVARCRHCKATAKVCLSCDGDGKRYGSDPAHDKVCPMCGGWGVLLPEGEGSDAAS